VQGCRVCGRALPPLAVAASDEYCRSACCRRDHGLATEGGIAYREDGADSPGPDTRLARERRAVSDARMAAIGARAEDDARRRARAETALRRLEHALDSATEACACGCGEPPDHGRFRKGHQVRFARMRRSALAATPAS
jgi:hypothetical protein